MPIGEIITVEPQNTNPSNNNQKVDWIKIVAENIFKHNETTTTQNPAPYQTPIYSVYRPQQPNKDNNMLYVVLGVGAIGLALFLGKK